MIIQSVTPHNVVTDKGNISVSLFPATFESKTITSVAELASFESEITEKKDCIHIQRVFAQFDLSLFSFSHTLSRPLGKIVTLPSGISLYVVSYDATRIVKASLANKRVKELFDKKIRGGLFTKGVDLSVVMLDDVFSLLNDICATVSQEVGFTLRVGADFAGNDVFDGKNYLGQYSPEDYFSFLVSLVDRYNLCFLQDSFVASDVARTKKLTQAVMHMAWVVKTKHVSHDVNAFLFDKPFVSVLENIGKNVPRIIQYYDIVDLYYAMHYTIPVVQYDISDVSFISVIEQCEQLLRKK